MSVEKKKVCKLKIAVLHTLYRYVRKPFELLNCLETFSRAMNELLASLNRHSSIFYSDNINSFRNCHCSMFKMLMKPLDCNEKLI